MTIKLTVVVQQVDGDNQTLKYVHLQRWSPEDLTAYLTGGLEQQIQDAIQDAGLTARSGDR